MPAGSTSRARVASEPALCIARVPPSSVSVGTAKRGSPRAREAPPIPDERLRIAVSAAPTRTISSRSPRWRRVGARADRERGTAHGRVQIARTARPHRAVVESRAGPRRAARRESFSANDFTGFAVPVASIRTIRAGRGRGRVGAIAGGIEETCGGIRIARFRRAGAAIARGCRWRFCAPPSQVVRLQRWGGRFRLPANFFTALEGVVFTE